jgi:prepilin-type N-terminal cleavage/methylation domain-containing protein
VKRLIRDQDGLTLVELMVALLILLILVGIAIPSFIGSRDSARDSEAKSAIREALPAVKAYIIDGAPLADIEAGVKELTPSVSIDPAAADGVALVPSAEGAVCVVRASQSGSVFAVWEPSIGMPMGTLYAELAAIPADCPALADVGAAGFSATAW